ncbi:ParA family protein [Aeoliella sp. SH292]|uniref:ParA family protein n=1 Tax=Aeoliella sp. SH292 TaxID=3454464 RepID=UPI003F9A4ED8
MAIIMFLNLKGGVAKTTNAVAIAECLASGGKRTLLIDADHQCTATELLLGEKRMEEVERSKRTLHDLFREMMKPTFNASRFDTYAAHRASNINGGLEHLSVIPCSVRMNDISSNLAKRYREVGADALRATMQHHRNQLHRWITSNFDYTIIDCPPSLSFQVKQLLQISTGYVVPCQPNRLSLRGADWLTKKLHTDGFRRHALGTIWSMYRAQDVDHRKIIEQAEYGSFEDLQFPRPFNTVVPMRAEIAHAIDTTWEPVASIHKKYKAEFHPVFVKLTSEIIARVDKQLGVSEKSSAPLEFAESY